MRAVLLIVCCLFLSLNSFAEDPDHGIPRPKEDKEEGIKRPVAPVATEAGFNGQLIWEKDFLFLQTPSGRKLRLSTTDKKIQEKLVKSAKEGKNHVELFGSVSEGKMKVTEIEDATVSDKNIERAEYLVELKDGISDPDKRRAAAAIKNIDGLKLGLVSISSPFIGVVSDLSQKQMQKLFSEDDVLKSLVRKVSKSIIKKGDISLDN